jgi:hypothetical protein
MVEIGKDHLVDTPRYGADEDPFTDSDYGAKVDAYYKTAPSA